MTKKEEKKIIRKFSDQLIIDVQNKTLDVCDVQDQVMEVVT